MLNKVIGSVILVIVALVSYFTGYQQGKYGEWLKTNKAPAPVVQVGEKEVTVVPGGFKWCEKNIFLSNNCTQTDSIAPVDMLKQGLIKPYKVQSGEEIHIKYPPRFQDSLKESSLMVEFDGKELLDHNYLVPNEPGVYIYHIYSKWANDQGEAIHIFALKVEN